MADIKITGASTLAKEDVERMVQEAESFAEVDKKKRELVDIKNQADSLNYQARKQLSECGDKLPEELKFEVEKKRKELEEDVNTDDISKIQASMDSLQQEVMKMGQAMYSQPGGDTQTSQQNRPDDTKEQNKNDQV